MPHAGMVATSLSDDGVELLGQRRGLEAYVKTHRTMGIPILYPWANRLSSNGYGVDGAVVTLTPGTGGIRTDQHGVPHHLALDVTLRDRTLTVRTTVTATTGSRVPLCYGFHPYLQLPDVPRAQWQIETPAMLFRPVDAWGLPTGEAEPRDASTELLGDRFIDDGYDEVPAGAVFAVSGGGRRIEVVFDEGYTAAQVFAPDDDVICFEPMCAPTDSLRRGGYREVQPGESASAQFSIKVS